MKIHLFLWVFGLVWFVGCSTEPNWAMEEQAQLPDETIIEFSIKEALGHGRFFHDYDHDHDDYGHGEADVAKAEEKNDSAFNRPK